MSCRVFAMHQPNYIPYLGYFHKMAHCDVFVYLDSVQYPKGGFAARNRIKGPSGAQYLTIPIRIPKGRHGKVSYPEVEYADSRWRKKHLGTIRANYARA